MLGLTWGCWGWPTVLSFLSHPKKMEGCIRRYIFILSWYRSSSWKYTGINEWKIIWKYISCFLYCVPLDMIIISYILYCVPLDIKSDINNSLQTVLIIIFFIFVFKLCIKQDLNLSIVFSWLGQKDTLLHANHRFLTTIFLFGKINKNYPNEFYSFG